jgi:hypothetical protein
MKRLRLEDGQVIVWSMLIMTVIFVVGAIVVDIGLYLSERRGAQTDADFASLAGAFELLNPGASASDAEDAAMGNLAANDEQDNIDWQDIVVDDSCFDRGVNDAVKVDVQHSSKALFFGIFGLAEPEIGAHAKACVGAAQAPGDLIPFQIDDNPGPCFDTQEEPKFTSMCPIELGAQGGNSSRGMLDLDAPGDFCSETSGAGDIEDLIEFGAPGICLINTEDSCDPDNKGGWYDCVGVQTGNPQNVLDGVNKRVVKDGLCDTDGDGVDEFSETVEVVFDTNNPFTSVYGARDCDPSTDGLQQSPRLVTIIVLEEPPPQNAGNTGFPIEAFAGFYLAGCAGENDVVIDEGQLDPDCDSPGARHLVPEDDYFVSAGLGPLLKPNACHQSPPRPHGQQQTCAPTDSPTPSASPTPTPSPSAVATATPTPPPSAASASPSPAPSPSVTPPPQPDDCSSPGHCVVYGRFVRLIVSNSDVGPPTDQTTLFGISLVE